MVCRFAGAASGAIGALCAVSNRSTRKAWRDKHTLRAIEKPGGERIYRVA